MPIKIALDTTFIAGLIDDKDVWHTAAHTLRPLLDNHNVQTFVLDCVMAEVVSILARRTHEKRRTAQLTSLLSRLRTDFPTKSITWSYSGLSQRYEAVVALVEQTGGELNFNDALIALSCRERGIDYIASFDADFDRVSWLKRVAFPADLSR